MEPCHVHHSSSTIKPYIATLIMRLYEDNKLDIDDPIREYLPADLVSKVANADIATIRHLLSHTSGQRNGYYYDKALVDMLNDPEEFVSTENMFEKYAYGRPALSAPGEEFHYSNIGYDMLGMIIEEVSKMSLGAYFKQEIIDPLGLENTYYKSYPGYPDKIPNVINRYARIKSDQLVNSTDIENKLANVSMGNIGLFATPYEFARFFQELLRGNILEPATLELMMEDQVQLHGNPDEEISYCFGLYHTRSGEFAPKYYHGGQNYGTSSLVLYFPDDDITISYSANMDSMFGDLGIFYDLWDKLEKVTFTGSRE